MKMWLILFAVQVLFAIILIIPLKAQLNEMLSHSLAGEEILRGIGANVFFEFITHYAQTISLEFSMLLIFGLVYLCISIFFNGGIITSFVKESGSFSVQTFFGGACLFFGRFLRLFLFSLVFMLLIIPIHIGIGTLFSWIAGDSEPIQVILQIVKIIILLFILFLIKMVFDYAKIRTVVFERHDMFKTGLHAWGFVYQHLGKTLGLYYLIAALGLLFFLLYTGIGKFNVVSTGFGILIILLWQQFYAFSRMGIKLLFYSAQVILYKEHTVPYLQAWFAEETSSNI